MLSISPSAAWLPCTQEHHPHSALRRKSRRRLQGEVSLLGGWEPSSLADGRALQSQVQMGFQAIFTQLRWFVFVDVNLEWALRRKLRCGTEEDQG
jgi:hypothetical protein